MGVRTPASAATGPLGRDRELSRLAELLDADAPVVLVGEAGVGKTTLAREALHRSGRRWLEGGGFGTLDWAPFLALERALRRSFAGADTAFAAREVSRAVGDGILFVDDLQWTDPGTRAVVAEVAGRLGLVVGVRRGDPRTDAVLTALPDSVTRIDLEPLDEVDACALALRVRPDLPPRAALAVARRAGGNPLLVTELASGGEDADTLASAVRVRLDALPAEGREAMVLLALAGHPMPAASLGAGAAALATSGLALVDADGRLKVRHELIGAAAADAVSESERRELHARLARRLADPGEAARHHAAAGEVELAHRRALEAVEASTTPGQRATHLAVAAETAPPGAALELRLAAAHALVDGFEGKRALELLAALSPDASRGNPAVALAFGRAHLSSYNLDDARAALAEGLAAIAPGDPATLPVEVWLRIESARRAVRALEDPQVALALAREAFELATTHGIATTAALGAMGDARYLARDLGAFDDLHAAVDAAFAEGAPWRALPIGGWLIFALLKEGRQAEGRAVAARLREQARLLRLTEWERQMAGWEVGLAWHGGDFAGAVELARALEAEGLANLLVDWYGTQALLDLGRVDEASVLAERWLETAIGGEYDLGDMLWISADAAFMAGRYAAAVAHADRHERELPDAQQRIFVELPAAWARFELGRPATWPHHASRFPILDGGEIELEALRALVEGRPEEAATQFGDAATAWRGRHGRGELRSLWAQGEALRRAGRDEEARRHLLTVEERLEAVRHAPFLARTRRSLRQLGVRRSAERRMAPGSPLTEREREILEMTGRGLRDGEIASRLGISRWAVVRAAESAAVKLGAASRKEAVAAAQA